MKFNTIIFFLSMGYLSNIYTVEIVSLGGACNIARACRHNNLRNTAYPFDWLITSLPALKKVFENDFSQVLIPEQTCERQDKKAVIDGYGLIFIHDFPTIRNQITPVDGEIMPVHELLSNWRESIDIVRAKFDRRLARLKDLLNSGKPVALVRYDEKEPMHKQDAMQFINMLKEKFPKAKLELVLISCAPDFKEPWNLQHISNLYLAEEDFKLWDGPAWSNIMHKIAGLEPQGWVKHKAYVLTSPLYNPGLFSVFNTVLGALDYYDQGYISGLEINFEDQGYYFDSARGNNWWQYYFEPIILGLDSDQVKKFPTYQKINFAYQSQFEMPRERAYELIQKYIHVKKHIIQKIDSFCKEHFDNNFVIGVHYRGTDKLTESSPVSYETIVRQIQTVLNQTTSSVKIFVATDDTHFASYIKEQFPNLVVMRDALRSDNGMGIHTRTDLDPYTKGEDAIIDCILLSRCNKLIKMASNLSDCSLFFNPHVSVIKLNTSYSE